MDFIAIYACDDIVSTCGVDFGRCCDIWMSHPYIITVCSCAVQAFDFNAIYAWDDRVLTRGGCAHHRRGAGWRHDSPVDSSYYHLEALSVPFACDLRRSFACCLRVPFCVDLTPHIQHAPHTTHHARQAGGVCRESDGGLLAQGVFQPIEIKRFCRKGSTQTIFTFTLTPMSQSRGLIL